MVTSQSGRKKRLSPREQEAEEARIAERIKEFRRETDKTRRDALNRVLQDVAEMSNRWRS